MKKKMAAFLAVSMMLCGQALAADFSNLVIIHTNDTHGFDRRAEGINGMATVSALRKHYLSQGKDVLLVDAGDAIQDNNLVNFSKGKSAIAFMNAAGYDAMALGNHEFDYGQDVLAERVREAKFPMLSANVIVEATGRPLTKDSVIYKKGDVKIGIIGLTTPETVVTTNPKNVYGLKFLDDKATIAVTQNLVKKLKEEDKCDLIVAVGHLGSEDANRGHRSDDILMNVNGIDIFIDGHDHTAKNKYINGALLAETGHYTKNIGVITYMDNKWTENFCKSQKLFLGTGSEAGTKDFTGVHIVLEVVVLAALKPPSDIQKILAVMKFLHDGGAELIRVGAIYQKCRTFLYFFHLNAGNACNARVIFPAGLDIHSDIIEKPFPSEIL